VTKRFTLYGSPHSLPTYKVALMLRLSNAPFSFRYVSFQKGMHKTPEFLALSRWGQVPVLLDNERVYLQSAAIVEHLAETLRQFQGADSATRQAVREWLFWGRRCPVSADLQLLRCSPRSAKTSSNQR
jgi:glutathione S-transferase